MQPAKRRKLSNDIDAERSDENFDDEVSGSEASFEASSDGSDDHEIRQLTKQKSHQTSKRKIRATAPSNFGATLHELLDADAPSLQPLSLKPSVARKRKDEKLESRAKKILQVEKKEKEDIRRVTDIIGEWGAENERALRKVAQRGVVKLFNAIQASQASAQAEAQGAKTLRGSGKPTLPAPVVDKKKDATNVQKNEFFDMIKSGGIVSKV